MPVKVSIREYGACKFFIETTDNGIVNNTLITVSELVKSAFTFDELNSRNIICHGSAEDTEILVSLREMN
jgi:hypothetical protein